MDTYFTWRGVLIGAGYCIGAVSPLLGLMLFVAVSNAAVTGVSPGHHHETEQSRSETVIIHLPEGTHVKLIPGGSDAAACEHQK